MIPEVPDGPLAGGARYSYWLAGRPAVDFAARCPSAGSTSRSWSGACRSSASGACSSTAACEPGLPSAAPHPLSGDASVDVQAALAMLAPEWGLEPLIDFSDEVARDQLARASVTALSFVAQSARGVGRPRSAPSGPLRSTAASG